MSKNVYTLISEVTALISKDGIEKNKKNTGQGYNFRGIDDTYNALSSVISTVGLVILPRFISREVTERQTSKGGSMFYVVVEAEFDLVSQFDGSKHTVKTYGEAMDSADKATNKAMSAAYKYAAFQTFCIPTEGEPDADAYSPPASSPKQTRNPVEAVQSQLASDDYEGYKAAHLPTLVSASKNGLTELQAAFKGLPASSSKAALWKAHGDELKAKASTPPNIDQSTGEVL